jgi:RimJ/RimL family protein N-acetyltransferase
MRPLLMEDLPALFAATPSGSFAYFLAEPTEWTLASFTQWAQAHLFRADQRPMLVLDTSGQTKSRQTGMIAGSSSFMDIQPAHRHVEVGCTWYSSAHRGSHVNPACKLLMLEHAFTGVFEGTEAHTNIGCERVTLKCDGRNLHSQRAIAKLGAVREGTLRRHRIRPDGFVRDTVYFSIVRGEWPSVQAKLVDRLHAMGVS